MALELGQYLKVIFGLAAGGIMALAGVFSVLTVYYSKLPHARVRILGAAVVALIFSILAYHAFAQNSLEALGVLVCIFLAALVWRFLITASLHRNWRDEVAVLPTAMFGENDAVTIKNIRNFEYRTDTDFDVRYYDKTFDLNELRGLDFIISYWGDDGGDEAIAHTFLSFEFADDQWLPISIEVRAEQGEEFHPLPGLFRQFELIYVVGDERDVIRVRTNYKEEETYAYPSTASPAQARALLVDMLERVNRIAERPAFYCSVSSNCTTSLVDHVNTLLDDKITFTRKLVLNGYSDHLAYERGLIKNDVPFAELKKACYISKIALSTGSSSEFSRRIRAQRRESIWQ